MSANNLKRIQKFEVLKKKRKGEAQKSKESITEVVKVKKTGVEEKKRKFEEIERRKTLQNDGVDLERLDNLQYSIQDVEAWNEKLAIKEESKETDFKSYASTAARKYRKDVRDLEISGMIRNANTEIREDDRSYGSHKDSPQAINNLITTLSRQDEKKKAFSRRREVKDDEDVTFINERNRNFNKKISRAYDKFTKEIKESFERGTAL